MLAIFNAQARAPAPWAVAAALLLVYVVWGTTYFATSIALQSMPPLLMNAVRFLCAGGVMLLIALCQGHALPTAVQWRNAVRSARAPLPGPSEAMARVDVRAPSPLYAPRSAGFGGSGLAIV